MAWTSLKVTIIAAAVLATVLSAGCASRKKTVQLVIPEKCADLTFPVYFASFGAGLNRAGHQIIDEAGRANKECRVVRVDVVGLADYRGAPNANLDLSRKRALAVAKALSRAGLPEPTFGVVAAGESGAIGEGGRAELMRRRAEVTIHYAPLS
jgi:outer membrane protein OmpA-like peptidoglycan-associated protein